MAIVEFSCEASFHSPLKVCVVNKLVHIYKANAVMAIRIEPGAARHLPAFVPFAFLKSSTSDILLVVDGSKEEKKTR